MFSLNKSAVADKVNITAWFVQLSLETLKISKVIFEFSHCFKCQHFYLLHDLFQCRKVSLGNRNLFIFKPLLNVFFAWENIIT